MYRTFFVGFALTACCPAPTGQLQATAFMAEVVGVSPGVPSVYLRVSPEAPLLTVMTDGVRILSRDGGSLPLSALRGGGARVYVTGTLTGDVGVSATELRVLER